MAGGSVYLFSVGFQSTFGYQQITNGGFDIDASGGGVDDRITIIGCRTESLRFYNGGASQPPILIGNKQSVGSASGNTVVGAHVQWQALTSNLALDTFVIRASLTLGTKLYRVTTTGTTGAVEPTWPDSGTVADGSAVWTLTDFDAVKVASGHLISNSWEVGFESRAIMLDSPTREITANYKATMSDELILCNNTTDITVTLPTFSGTGPVRQNGKKFIIKKVLTNSSTVTIVSSDGGNLDGAGGPVSIPGGSTGWIGVEAGGGGAFSGRHWIISKSIDPDQQFRRLRLNQGTSLVTGDFALSAGWGTTASVAVTGGSKDARGTITVTSTGTGQGANPTITLTFKDGAWPATPFAVVSRGGGSQRTVPVTVNSISTTALVIRLEGTPVAAETFELSWMVQS